jgi:aspartate racemase
MHFGLIGGIGPAATEFYYRGLVRRHARRADALELTIVQADVRDQARNMAANNPRAQAEIFARLISRLAAAGAQEAAVTSLGGHFCINELMTISPLPLINAIPAVAAEIAHRNIRTLGILGTATVMQSGLYGCLSGIDIVLPKGDLLQHVSQTYMAMATIGQVTQSQRDVFFTAGRALCEEQGADAVLLGGTDLFLAFEGQDCGFPVLDGADIHIDAIHQRAIAG